MPKLSDRGEQSSHWWDRLPDRAREFLKRQGVEEPPAPSASFPAPPSSSQPPPAAQPDVEPPGKSSRAERRAGARVERRSTRQTGRRLPSSKGRRREIAKLKAAAQERDRRYLDRLRARMRERGLEQGQPPRLIPREVWIMARDILADPSGKAARIWMKRARNKVAVGCIRLAALVPGEDGTTRYSWEGNRPENERARRICVLGLALLHMAVGTARRGIWTTIVRGLTRGAWLALLADPFSGRRPALTTLAGTHREGGTFETGQVGYLRALEQAGLCYSQQLPTGEVQPFERWRNASGEEWSCNRYWVIGAIPTAALDDEQKQALLALHKAGWDAPDEQVQLSPERLGRGLRFADRPLVGQSAQPP